MHIIYLLLLEIVPETNTSRQVENTKVNEVIILKELGKITLYLRKKEFFS